MPEKPKSLEQLVKTLRREGFEVEDPDKFFADAVRKPPVAAQKPGVDQQKRDRKAGKQTS